MNQTLKPDRPIWPPVPETSAPPDTRSAEAKPADRASTPADRPKPDTGALECGTVAGFRAVPG